MSSPQPQPPPGDDGPADTTKDRPADANKDANELSMKCYGVWSKSKAEDDRHKRSCTGVLMVFAEVCLSAPKVPNAAPSTDLVHLPRPLAPPSRPALSPRSRPSAPLSLPGAPAPATGRRAGVCLHCLAAPQMCLVPDSDCARLLLHGM